jgi:hypothetical protein
VGTTKNSSKVRLLDLSRTVARAGRVPSGIDRVELAYLRELVALGEPFFGLIRTRVGYLLLDVKGAARLQEAVEGGSPSDECLKIARDLAAARCPRALLGWVLRRRFPLGLAYINVGHSNLTRRALSAVRSTKGGTVTVLLHDMIPLDFPEYQKAGRSKEFGKRMQRVSGFADQVICISQAARGRIERHLAGFGRVPRIVTAPIGVVPISLRSEPSSRARTSPFCSISGRKWPRTRRSFSSAAAGVGGARMSSGGSMPASRTSPNLPGFRTGRFRPCSRAQERFFFPRSPRVSAFHPQRPSPLGSRFLQTTCPPFVRSSETEQFTLM